MAAEQAEDIRASLRIVGDLNGHHQECLGSTTTNRQGVAAFDFTTVSGCDQLALLSQVWQQNDGSSPGRPLYTQGIKGSPRRGTYKELLPLEEWGVRHACP